MAEYGLLEDRVGRSEAVLVRQDDEVEACPLGRSAQSPIATVLKSNIFESRYGKGVSVVQHHTVDK